MSRLLTDNALFRSFNTPQLSCSISGLSKRNMFGELTAGGRPIPFEQVDKENDKDYDCDHD